LFRGNRNRGEQQQRETAAQSSADNAWMLVSAALVLMMTGPGLALFLWRAGAAEEHAGDHDAELRVDGVDYSDVGSSGV